MNRDGDLIRRVCGLTALVVALIAAVAGLFGGPREMLGALIGGAIALANFVWLARAARAALAAASAPGPRPRRALLWLGASGARFAVVGGVLGLAVAAGGLGLAGLAAALVALPVAVVTEGLRAARST